MMKLEKSHVRYISFAVAMIFVIGILFVGLSQANIIRAAGSSNVGYADYKLLVTQQPDMAKVQQQMDAAVAQAKQDLAAKSAQMNAQDRQAYQLQLEQGLAKKEKELLDPIKAKVDAAVKQVADAKGITVILDKSAIIIGGQDITDEVAKKLKG